MGYIRNMNTGEVWGNDPRPPVVSPTAPRRVKQNLITPAMAEAFKMSEQEVADANARIELENAQIDAMFSAERPMVEQTFAGRAELRHPGDDRNEW